ncbi:MAG TPA: carboxypeptidase-like regulatory domain-containing protein [Candidatus Angelobacter sp.]|jgi:hypothetical protein
MLNNIRVASPCPADWNKMPGNDRVRYCQACNLNVYNLPAFTESEIRELVANRQGRLCGRLYQRRDGTVLTENCPVGLRAVTRRISRFAGAILAVLSQNLVTAPMALAQSYMRTNVSNATILIDAFDPTGVPVPSATVTLREPSRNLNIRGKTDKHGRAVLRAPRSGQYILDVTAPGLHSLSQPVNLRAGEVLSMPVRVDVEGIMGVIELAESGSKPSRDSVAPSQPAMPIRGSGPAPMQR